MPRPKAQIAALMASVDDVEAQFYEALQRGDLERLMAVWSDDDEVVCVHPGGPRVVGHGAIRATFDAMFATDAGLAPPAAQLANSFSCIHAACFGARLVRDHSSSIAHFTSSSFFIISGVAVSAASLWSGLT